LVLWDFSLRLKARTFFGKKLAKVKNFNNNVQYIAHSKKTGDDILSRKTYAWLIRKKQKQTCNTTLQCKTKQALAHAHLLRSKYVFKNYNLIL
jgi:hypothetical protein